MVLISFSGSTPEALQEARKEKVLVREKMYERLCIRHPKLKLTGYCSHEGRCDRTVMRRHLSVTMLKTRDVILVENRGSMPHIDMPGGEHQGVAQCQEDGLRSGTCETSTRCSISPRGRFTKATREDGSEQYDEQPPSRGAKSNDHP